MKGISRLGVPAKSGSWCGLKWVVFLSWYGRMFKSVKVVSVSAFTDQGCVCFSSAHEKKLDFLVKCG